MLEPPGPLSAAAEEYSAILLRLNECLLLFIVRSLYPMIFTTLLFELAFRTVIAGFPNSLFLSAPAFPPPNKQLFTNLCAALFVFPVPPLSIEGK